MLLLTIALATTLREVSEGDIENHLNMDADAKLMMRRTLGGALTAHLSGKGIISGSEEVFIPYIAITNVEGFGAHD